MRARSGSPHPTRALLRDHVEHAVHECGRAVPGETARDLDGFIDDHLDGCLGLAEQLVAGHSQDVPVDGREPRELPMGAGLAQARIDPLQIPRHAEGDLERARSSARGKRELIHDRSHDALHASGIDPLGLPCWVW